MSKFKNIVSKIFKSKVCSVILSLCIAGAFTWLFSKAVVFLAFGLLTYYIYKLFREYIKDKEEGKIKG